MNRFSCGLKAMCGLAVLVACGGPAAAPSPSSPAAPPAPASASAIVAFGDSLTAGKDLLDPGTQAWPAVLERLLRAKGIDARVANSGASGNTTYEALDRLDFSVPRGTDLVIVQFGANDTFQGKRIEEIERNLVAIVERSREKGARVILWDMKTLPNLGGIYAGRFERIFRRVAERTDCVLAPFPLEGVAGNPAMNLPDDLHPNPAGHERIARNLLPIVERNL